ncbi:hypothetical protein PFISCL1PPCAC_19530, partial [Pristionchus fissidentatus]
SSSSDGRSTRRLSSIPHRESSVSPIPPSAPLLPPSNKIGFITTTVPVQTRHSFSGGKTPRKTIVTRRASHAPIYETSSLDARQRSAINPSLQKRPASSGGTRRSSETPQQSRWIAPSAPERSPSPDSLPPPYPIDNPPYPIDNHPHPPNIPPYPLDQPEVG